MIKLEEDRDTIYAVAKGQLDDEDYNEMLPLLRNKVNEYGKINWYFQMVDFKGWTPKAAWDDLLFDFRNKDNLKKVAMVGTSTWQKLMTQTMKPFTSATIRYYDEDDAQEAKAWVSS